jgi:hypothetical protein
MKQLITITLFTALFVITIITPNNSFAAEYGKFSGGTFIVSFAGEEELYVDRALFPEEPWRGVVDAPQKFKKMREFLKDFKITVYEMVDDERVLKNTISSNSLPWGHGQVYVFEKKGNQYDIYVDTY